MHPHILDQFLRELAVDSQEFRQQLLTLLGKVGVFLEHLSPQVVVHRLNAVANRWEDIVAPDWARSKMGTTQLIRDLLARENSWQGRRFATPPTMDHDREEFPRAAMAKGGC